MKLEFIEHSDLLPPEWDQAFGLNPLKSRLFLKHLQATNQVSQRYFWKENKRAQFGGCIYRAVLPFRVGPVVFYQMASFCGIPMPFGIETGFSDFGRLKEAAEAMDCAWPGFQMILGLPQRGSDIPGWSWKRHLPGVCLDLAYSDFNQYLHSLRHNYRKLVNRSLRKWSRIRVLTDERGDFTSEEYRLYLEVLGKQKYKTEALDIAFFQNIPVGHSFIKAYAGDRLIGWILLAPNDRKLYSLFLGIDKNLNQEYDTYFNVFLETIGYAISGGYTKIHFGQTAEFTKMRLGGVPSERYILVRHTNPLINELIKRTDVFNYRKYYPPMRVVKDNG